MTTLEAQGLAARRTRDLRDIADSFVTLLGRLADADRDLRALRPHLSPAAAAEVDAVLDQISDTTSAALISALNPSGDPA